MLSPHLCAAEEWSDLMAMVRRMQVPVATSQRHHGAHGHLVKYLSDTSKWEVRLSDTGEALQLHAAFLKCTQAPGDVDNFVTPEFWDVFESKFTKLEDAQDWSSIVGMEREALTVIDAIRAEETLEEEVAVKRKVAGIYETLARAFQAVLPVGQSCMKSNHMRWIEHCLSCRDLAKTLGDALKEAVVLGLACESHMFLAQNCGESGRYEKAIAMHREQLQVAQQPGDRNQIGIAVLGLGNAYLQLCPKSNGYQPSVNKRLAHEHYCMYLTVMRKLGNRSGEAAAFRRLGSIDFGSNQDGMSALFGEAQLYFEQWREIAKETGDWEGQADACILLRCMYLASNACILLRMHVSCFKCMYLASNACILLQNVYLRQGNESKSLERRREHDSLRRPGGIPQAEMHAREVSHALHTGAAALRLGFAHHVQGKFDLAICSYSEFLRLLRGQRKGCHMRLNIGQEFEETGSCCLTTLAHLRDFLQLKRILAAAHENPGGASDGILPKVRLHDESGDAQKTCHAQMTCLAKKTC